MLSHSFSSEKSYSPSRLRVEVLPGNRRILPIALKCGDPFGPALDLLRVPSPRDRHWPVDAAERVWIAPRSEREHVAAGKRRLPYPVKNKKKTH
jgi:hypothetical protein